MQGDTADSARSPTPQQYDEAHLARLNAALDEFGSAGLASVLPSVGVPEEVGPYKILELIGEGGMGSVSKAEQRRPVQRIVALKLVKPGLDTRVVLARFEAERQALARMDHANIAKVLDAGADHFGRPYFVMEYVAGKPITRFADEHRLSIRDRLLLFCQVCDAIAHAHTKAILHRDIKASNVLAYMNDGRPTVKVIDFGVAKAITGDRLTEVSFSTDRGAIVGTYDSMSPEQADSSPDIDTRTDVYSLGVLLYELLAGAKPFDKEQLTSVNDQELRRIIREVEAPRPSSRLASLGSDRHNAIAEARQIKPEALFRQLRGELEWIPMMALRKARERRYSSPVALADDVRSYLAGRPLVAGPESRTYVARKFLRRHRSGAMTVAAILILAISGISFYLHRIRAEQKRTLAALQKAEEQRRFAESQTELAHNAKDFLGEMLRSVSPSVSRGKPVLVIDVLRNAVKRVETSFDDRLDTRAQLHTTLGEALASLGEIQEALQQHQSALEIRRKLWGPDASMSIASEASCGEMLQKLGRWEEAEAHFRENLRRCGKYFKSDDARMLRAKFNLGNMLLARQRYDESEQLLQDVYETRLAKLGQDDRETLRAASRYAAVLRWVGRTDEAESLLRTALQRLHWLEGDDSPDVASLRNGLGVLLMQAKRYDEADPFLRGSLEYNRRVLPPGHNDLIIVVGNFAKLQHLRGQMDEALALARESHKMAHEQFGADHPQTLRGLVTLRRILVDAGQTTEAVAIARELLERRRRLSGPEHADTRDAMRVLAATLMRDRRRGEAIDLMQQVVEIGQRVSGSNAKETIADVKELARYQTEPIFPPMRLGSFEIFRADLLDPRGPALPLSSR